MDPATKSSLLWGAVGGFAFLSLVQAYTLATGQFVGVAVTAGVAVGVSLVAGATAHALRPRLAGWNERT